jgi:transcriptional regulator with XRE-family HTH domain
MAEVAVSLWPRTVRSSLTVVNTVVPVDAEGADSPGERLRSYIDARWGRRKGGIRGLAAKLNVSAETMYEWFRGEREPNLDHLTRMAEALGVKRSEILAAMDGEAPVVALDDATRRAIREEIEAVLDERRGQP